MADALVSALVSTILRNITSFSVAEMGILGYMSDELQKLESSLSTIQAVLQDAEQKQRKSEAINNWLRKLKAVAYCIENTLDEFATESLARRLHPNLSNQVSRFFSLSNPLFLRIRAAHRLKTLREKLDFIATEKHQFHLAELGDTEASEREWRETSSLVIESEILGRDEEKESIVGLLINQVRDSDDTSIVSICGMGGLGKTTLAQLVYNDERVVGAFDLRCWVCVSDNFDIRRLTRAILESIEGISCNIQELDPLQRCLVEKLVGKRFLLVLDDVWNESESQWARLKEVFRYGARGSTVVVTTRIEKIALMMSTERCVHYVGYLSNDASWNLFKRHVFESSDCGDCVHLEVIGKEIVKKCGGVPLAIKVLGSLLRSKRQETEWLSVKESEIWNLEDKDSKLLCEILRLSYDNLSPHLRQCFAFCALFPKDYVMRKEQLIQLWMADGFIPSRAHMDLHDVGCEIFNELTQRSFFMDVEEVKGEIHCKMHDLMHDLALSIVRDECFTISGSYKEEFQLPNNVHHLCTTNPDLVHRASKIQSLRSLVVLDSYWRTNSFSRSRNRYLRTLVLARCNQRNYIVLHGCKQLRHLDLSGSSIKVLPNSVSCLHNLQTINLRGCYQLEKLPKDMNHMKELVYLDITRCYRLVCLPVRMGKLVRLRKLSKFIVGKENGYGIDELQDLDLGGELTIEQLGNVKDIREARSANLMRKQNLRSLTLSWKEGTSRNIVPDETAGDVLEGLHPHPNLKILTISGFPGGRLPEGLGDLTSLMVLELSKCDSLVSIPENAFGSLSSLSSLTITYCEKLSSLPDSCQYLTALEDLSIIKCPELTSLPDSIGCLTALQRLSIFGCEGLTALPNDVSQLTSLSTLHISGCPELTSLPDSIGCLTALQRLSIENCKRLTALPNDVSQLTTLSTLDISGCPKIMSLPDSIGCLTALHKLSICKCEGLTALPNDVSQLASLSKLDISGCPEITSLPDSIGFLTALQTLSIQNCKGSTALPNDVSQLTSLSTLHISGCPEITLLPDSIRCLTALQRLSIENCKGLTTLPNDVSQLTSLSTLVIHGCQKITSLPDSIGCLTALRRLSIHNCNGLTALPNDVRQLTSLSTLVILGCPKITSLPDSIGHLTALQSLSIFDCEGLTTLPNDVSQLTSLSQLYIGNCPNLRCMPEGLQDLTTLSRLRIVACRLLERRCEKQMGADWPKIAHIHEVIIEKDNFPRRPSPPRNLLARLADCTSQLYSCCRAHDN